MRDFDPFPAIVQVDIINAVPKSRDPICDCNLRINRAGFPHLYFPANQSIKERFVRKATDYAQKHV